ncbi:MAG: MFS transporter [Armatimonadota bacterium]
MAKPNSHDTSAEPRFWFQGISGYAWLVLIVAALGWLFDTFDQQLFTLIRNRSLEEILTGTVPAEELKATVQYWGYILTSVFLTGFAIGGFVFGILGDKIGRTRTMMITIFVYAAFTGLNSLVHTPYQYALCRFLTALGIGGEFAAGASIVAEVWPQRSRPMALGVLQALSTVGNMLAAAVTFVLATTPWQYVYLVGIAPALLVVVIRVFLKEPETWKAAATDAHETHKELGSVKELFTNREIRRNTYAALLIASAGVLGLWGIGYFQTDFLRQMMKAANYSPVEQQKFTSLIFGLRFQIGGFIGMYLYAAVSQRIGRRPALALVYIAAVAVIQGAFWQIHRIEQAAIWSFFLGMCTLAPFAAFGVYFPELFPTRLRSTGVGICYNAARLLAAVGIWGMGSIAAHFTRDSDPVFGYRMAATIMSSIYILGFIGIWLAPETKGKPLPT